MQPLTDVLNHFPPIVRLVVLLMAAGAAYLLVMTLQQQSGELLKHTKRSL